jgi:hypothetical protein
MTRRLLVILVLVVAAGAGTGPAPTPAAAQTTASFRVVMVGDISPPTNETKGDDHATAELIAKLDPDLVCLLGDVQYETGSGAMFNAPVGFDGSYGRLFRSKIRCVVQGNHDAADPGPGAPSLTAYFADALDLPCKADPTPCDPAAGYWVLDLDANRDGRPDWYILGINSNCQRASGGTGDVQTPSCANDAPMLNWMRVATAARHGGTTSGRKCSIVVDHHERWGSGFFADDPALNYPWQVGNHYHYDVWESGHTHSMARMGALTWDGHLSSTGSGQRQITSGAGGRSLTPFRVSPPREGTRERYNDKYGVQLLTLTVAQSPAGWVGGTWTSQFLFVDGTSTTPASAGCWP